MKKAKDGCPGPTDAQVNRSLISPNPPTKNPNPSAPLPSPGQRTHIDSEVRRESEGGRTVNLKNISIVTATPLAGNARIIPEWAHRVGIHHQLSMRNQRRHNPRRSLNEAYVFRPRANLCFYVQQKLLRVTVNKTLVRFCQ